MAANSAPAALKYELFCTLLRYHAELPPQYDSDKSGVEIAEANQKIADRLPQLIDTQSIALS